MDSTRFTNCEIIELNLSLRSRTRHPAFSPPTLQVLDILAGRFPGAVLNFTFATSWFHSREGAVKHKLPPRDKAICNRCIEDSEAVGALLTHYLVETEGNALILAIKAGFEAGFTAHFIK